MPHISDIFDEGLWNQVNNFEFQDITYHVAKEAPVARIAFNRPEVRNAFRPETVDELILALQDVRSDTNIGAVILTGNGPSPKDGGWAFCSGGDQNSRDKNGYAYTTEQNGSTNRLHILECQQLIRMMPKVVIASVPGWAVGGGHSLHVVCDLTIASAEHAKFKQTDTDVASFDGGFGSAYLAKQVGQKRAREIFFLGQTYTAQEAFDMGAVNKVVPHDQLEPTALEWAITICEKSPTAQKMVKYALNLADDGLIGQQIFAGEATRLLYGTDEAEEGRNAFLEKRDPKFDQFPYHY